MLSPNLIVAIIYSLLAALQTSANLTSDYEYYESIGGFLKLHLVSAPWHDARLRCNYEGGVLVSPINQSYVDAMKYTMTKKNIKHLYTGIHAIFSSGDFTTVEGIPLEEINLNWAAGEPLQTHEDCLFMTPSGDLGDISCDRPFPYMCYKKAPNRCDVTICGTNDQGYKYNEKTHSCYKVHRLGRTWSRGFMTCHAEGAHMAIINSPAEADAIKELLVEHPADKLFADYTHVFSIGYQNWGERGSWWTIHGQELSEAGYDKWEKGSPDGKTSQFCGGVNRSGRLNDIWCKNGTFAVICELTPH